MARSRKVPFNCYLSVEQLDALDIASEREGRPRAELVREAVTQYLTGRDEPAVVEGAVVETEEVTEFQSEADARREDAETGRRKQ